jgi:hypothetical protein
MSLEMVPDLSGYRLHRRVQDAEFEGVAVPGLRAEFFRRPEGARTATVGRYHYGGRELLLAWGFVDEPHCRYSCVRRPDGRWGTPTAGCPEVRVVRDDGGRVAGFQVRDEHGRWTGALAEVPAG